MLMDIEFDPNKDKSNIIKHGISLARAREFDLVKLLEDDRKNYGETRYRAFGFVGKVGHVLAFTVVERRTGAKRVRAISLRAATETEIERYGLSKKGRR
ncbi:BrnT family toxin [Bradyrhizobium sp. B024]|uniref:BrnT family toxin n=1 Tax=Bradyrhizobium sp. B024 TaxID=3140247 RepID=UPI0031837C6A